MMEEDEFDEFDELFDLEDDIDDDFDIGDDDDAFSSKQQQQQQQRKTTFDDYGLDALMDNLNEALEKDPMVEKQMQLEEQTLANAQSRYKKSVSSATKRKQGSSLRPATRVQGEWYKPFVEKIRAYQSQCVCMTPGDMEKSLREASDYLPLISADKLAWITMYVVLGTLLMDKKQNTVHRMCSTISDAVMAEINMGRLKKHPHARKFIQNKNNLKVRNINSMARFVLTDTEHAAENIPHEKGLHLGTLLIDTLLSVATIPVAGEDGKPTLVPALTRELVYVNGRSLGVIRAHEELYTVIDEQHVLREVMELKPLPMVTKPIPWSNYDAGAYITRKSMVMRTKGSALQRFVLRDAVMNDLFDGLNVLNETPWMLHQKVFHTVQRVWEEGGGLDTIPSRADDVLPEMPVQSDDATTAEYDDLLRKWKKKYQRIQIHNRNLHSLRCDLIYKLQVAEDFKDQTMYFPHNIDFRGRAYPIPPHLNHMGSDLNRSLLTFKNGQPIGERGIFWLKIHLANLCGKDKLSFKERVEFIDAHLEDIFDSATQPLEGQRWWLDAENPWQTLASCIELTECLQSPVPEEFVSHLPVQMDGSCNGLQHYAALGRDNLGALHVNLLPTEKPMDVYNGVLAVVLKNLEYDATVKDDDLAKTLLGKVYRSTIKQTVMTSVYGVTFVGARDQIGRRLKEKKEIPEDLIYASSVYLARNTLKSLGEVFRSATEIMDWLNEIAHLISSENEPVMWITPLGLPIVQPYFSTRRVQVQTVLQSVTVVDRRDELPVSRERQKSAFPPNYVHSLDASHMFLTAKACKAEGIEFAAVHDSFWCHAAHVERMNQIIREQFIFLHSQPLLETLAQSLSKLYPHIEFPPVPLKGSLNLKRVLEADYFFD